MLTISPGAVEALRESAKPAFVVRTQAELSEKYPHFLPRFPEAIGQRIVANMLGRASGWGLSRQRGLRVWCEWMITIAPNFDEDPDIRAALEQLPTPPDHHILDLPSAVHADAWRRAERNASTLPFFCSPGSVDRPTVHRMSEALTIVLHDRPEGGAGVPFATTAVERAAALGLGDHPDAALVVASCLSFWGGGFDQLHWMQELARERWDARATVEAMKLRLALEFGRFV